MISIVVARSANGVIGRDGGLPWRLPTDLKRFRDLTLGHTVVMGRRTFESLPAAYRPLPGRRNVVLSSDPGYEAEGAEVFDCLEAALDSCPDGCFVIGGGVTYDQALPLAGRVYATVLEDLLEGDTYFPDLPRAEWRAVEQSDRLHENGHWYRFEIHERAA